MILKNCRTVLMMMCLQLLKSVALEPVAIDTASLKNIANVSYAAEGSNISGLASIFSPRMDFEQWKPLTGRGDPLRNDPTYDYEPPVLERVRYWADDTRLEREHYPDRKSEVLMLGVSSRKPSTGPRPSPPRRHHRPPPPKYEDYSYKLSEHYPMTILVPPPPPPTGHKPSIYVPDDKRPQSNSHVRITIPPKLQNENSTAGPEHLTSLYALQEANLIYQSSTTSQNWILDLNQTSPNSAVSSDYAGWGPTTPVDDIDIANDTHNFISVDHIELSKHPYLFYKPMLSEAPPPPPQNAINSLLTTFVPTAIPSQIATEKPTTQSAPYVTWPSELTTTETPTTTENMDYNIETTTDDSVYNLFSSTPDVFQRPNTENNLFDMLKPMMSMPLVNGPERPEDNLYAHATENLQVYKEHEAEDITKLETLQTMQPPPPVNHPESHNMQHKQPNRMNSVNSYSHKKNTLFTQDPYLNMRYSSPLPTIAASIEFENIKTTTEVPTVPMYLIIQGHSKVKTYGSQPKSTEDIDTILNEISKPNETNEVKHLHPIKEKQTQKIEKKEINRKGKLQNLRSLVDLGRGSIEIQETDIGIKYDVSDGSEVPIELYKKGIVNNEENVYGYKSSKIPVTEKRTKRQIGLEDMLPDEDTLEEYVYNFLKTRSNSTGITGLIAQAITGKGSAILDDLDDDSHEER